MRRSVTVLLPYCKRIAQGAMVNYYENAFKKHLLACITLSHVIHELLVVKLGLSKLGQSLVIHCLLLE